MGQATPRADRHRCRLRDVSRAIEPNRASERTAKNSRPADRGARAASAAPVPPQHRVHGRARTMRSDRRLRCLSCSDYSSSHSPIRISSIACPASASRRGRPIRIANGAVSPAPTSMRLPSKAVHARVTSAVKPASQGIACGSRAIVLRSFPARRHQDHRRLPAPRGDRSRPYRAPARHPRRHVRRLPQLDKARRGHHRAGPDLPHPRSAWAGTATPVARPAARARQRPVRRADMLLFPDIKAKQQANTEPSPDRRFCHGVAIV